MEETLFSKIIKGEIPSKKIYEDDYVFSFEDIQPLKKIHILVVPKNVYRDLSDFILRATVKEKEAIFEGIYQTVLKQGLDKNGYRLITNEKDHGGQQVFHLHFHILGGEFVGPLVL